MPDPRPTWGQLLRDPAMFCAFGFGSGLAPRAPGTMGTLAAVPLYWLMFSYLSPIAYAAVVVLTAVLGIWLCGHSANKLGVHDHGGIVWDEFVGFWIGMLPVVFVANGDWRLIVVGFVLFRIFDILKPWPISALDRNLKGGLGIMADDWLAGFNTAVVMYGIHLWQIGQLTI